MGIHYYTFNSIGNTKHKYDTILDYVAKNYNKEFTRYELLVKSGYTNRLNSSGHFSSLTSALNHYDIIHYNSHTRKWSAGKNFFGAYGKKVVGELNN